MKWLYGLILIFIASVVYFLYRDYRKGTVTKKSFVTAAVLESIAALLLVWLLVT